MNLYRLLLHLYPSSFRAEYGGEMRAIFAVELERIEGTDLVRTPVADRIGFARLTTMAFDGKAVDWGEETPIADGYDVWRLDLAGYSGNAHTLEASTGVGVQVLGYGLFTSYQYPAGLNLKRIAGPPPLK